MSAEAAPALRRPPFSLLPRQLREARHPAVTILIGWGTAFLPSILLAAIIGTLMPDAETPHFPVSGLTALFMLVVFAPVVETLIMGAVILVLLRFLGPAAAIVASAAGWAIAHSLQTPMWGLVIWWPFLIFSLVFVTWRERSVAAAFAMATAVHAMNNLLPAIPIAYPELI